MRRGGPCWARDNHYDGAALLTSINDVALLRSGLHGHEANRAWLGGDQFDLKLCGGFGSPGMQLSDVAILSAFRGKADMSFCAAHVRF